jgi:hypothetical protein
MNTIQVDDKIVVTKLVQWVLPAKMSKSYLEDAIYYDRGNAHLQLHNFHGVVHNFCDLQKAKQQLIQEAAEYFFSLGVIIS